MYCINCGKEIDDGASFCPACGAAQKPTATSSNATHTNQSTVQKAPYDTMSIVGLVISGISLLLNFWGIVGIAGTIVSVIGLINCNQKNKNGKIFAIIGIIIGGWSIIYGVISLLSLM